MGVGKGCQYKKVKYFGLGTKCKYIRRTLMQWSNSSWQERVHDASFMVQLSLCAPSYNRQLIKFPKHFKVKNVLENEVN